MQKRSAIVALMAVFTLGICFIVIGAVSEELKSVLGFTNAQIGSMVSALFFTSMIVQVFIGMLVDKFGYKPFAILGFGVVTLSMFLLAVASSFAAAMFASILLGVGAMCVNTVGNTLIPVVLFDGKDPARASNFGNAFFGLGLVVTPLLPVFIMGTLGLGYAVALSVIGALSLIFLIFAVTTKYPEVATGYRVSMAFKLLGKASVLLAALALICYISLESSMNTWLKPLMTELYGGDTMPGAITRASLVLSLFGISMMVGRFITSTIKNLTSIGVRLIVIMSIISIVAILMLKGTSSTAIAILGVIVVGLAFAPIFPTIVGVTFSKFQPNLYGSIFGIIFAVGLLGGTFVPKIIGDLAEGKTVQESLMIAVVMAALLGVVALLMGRTKDTETVE